MGLNGKLRQLGGFPIKKDCYLQFMMGRPLSLKVMCNTLPIPNPLRALYDICRIKFYGFSC